MPVYSRAAKDSMVARILETAKNRVVELPVAVQRAMENSQSMALKAPAGEELVALKTPEVVESQGQDISDGEAPLGGEAIQLKCASCESKELAPDEVIQRSPDVEGESVIEPNQPEEEVESENLVTSEVIQRSPDVEGESVIEASQSEEEVESENLVAESVIQRSPDVEGESVIEPNQSEEEVESENEIESTETETIQRKTSSNLPPQPQINLSPTSGGNPLPPAIHA